GRDMLIANNQFTHGDKYALHLNGSRVTVTNNILYGWKGSLYASDSKELTFSNNSIQSMDEHALVKGNISYSSVNGNTVKDGGTNHAVFLEDSDNQNIAYLIVTGNMVYGDNDSSKLYKGPT